MANKNTNNKKTDKKKEEAKKAICIIHLSKGFGSGFLCKIPYTENNNILLPVLITNNHVLSKIENKCSLSS